MPHRIYQQEIDHPLQTQHLPTARPAVIELPLRSRGWRNDATKALFGQLLAVAGTIVGLMFHDWLRPLLFSGLYTLPLLFILARALLLVATPRQIFVGICLLVAFSILWMPIFCPYLGSDPRIEWDLTYSGVNSLVACIGFAYLLAQHYAGHASAGLYAPAVRTHFRKTWQLPAGVKRASTLRGYLDALCSWAAYDETDSQAPGVWKSSAGPQPLRLVLPAVTAMVLAVGMQDFALAGQRMDGGPLLQLYCLLGPLTAPLPVIHLVSLMAGRRAFANGLALKRAQMHPELYEGLFEALRSTPDALEKKSVLAGIVASDGSPIMVPLSTVSEHAIITGKTGSGKTSYFLYLLDQFLTRWPISIVYIDLKSTSNEIIETMRIGHERRLLQGVNSRFWFFTNAEDGRASHLMSLFTQPWWRGLNSVQRTDILISAFGLHYSTSYGQSYYRDSAWKLMNHVMTKHPQVESFAELSDCLAIELRNARPHELSPKLKEDGEHVRFIIDRLALTRALHYDNNLPQTTIRGGIDLSRVFTEPSLVYVGLSSLQGGPATEEIARLFLHGFTTAGSTLSTAERTTQVIFVVDEWQRIVSTSLEPLLQQGRSMNASFWLLNQTAGDWTLGGTTDLTDTVLGNTAFGAWFGTTDPTGCRILKDLGGQYIETFTSTTTGGRGAGTTTQSRQVVDRISQNVINEATTLPNHFLLQLPKTDGYASYANYPFIAYQPFHITAEEYAKRREAQWPSKAKDTLPKVKPNPHGGAQINGRARKHVINTVLQRIR